VANLEGLSDERRFPDERAVAENPIWHYQLAADEINDFMSSITGGRHQYVNWVTSRGVGLPSCMICLLYIPNVVMHMATFPSL